MLRVQRNKQRKKLGQGEKTGTSPSYWSELKVRGDATHAEALTLTHTRAAKLKVNIVHVGVAELLFISLLTSVCVCVHRACL